jgi:hypothetical protein
MRGIASSTPSRGVVDQQLGAVSTMIVARTLMLAWIITPGHTDPDLA